MFLLHVRTQVIDRCLPLPLDLDQWDPEGAPDVTSSSKADEFSHDAPVMNDSFAGGINRSARESRRRQAAGGDGGSQKAPSYVEVLTDEDEDGGGRESSDDSESSAYSIGDSSDDDDEDEEKDSNSGSGGSDDDDDLLCATPYADAMSGNFKPKSVTSSSSLTPTPAVKGKGKGVTKKKEKKSKGKMPKSAKKMRRGEKGAINDNDDMNYGEDSGGDGTAAESVGDGSASGMTDKESSSSGTQEAAAEAPPPSRPLCRALRNLSDTLSAGSKDSAPSTLGVLRVNRRSGRAAAADTVGLSAPITVSSSLSLPMERTRRATKRKAQREAQDGEDGEVAVVAPSPLKSSSSNQVEELLDSSTDTIECEPHDDKSEKAEEKPKGSAQKTPLPVPPAESASLSSTSAATPTVVDDMVAVLDSDSDCESVIDLTDHSSKVVSAAGSAQGTALDISSPSDDNQSGADTKSHHASSSSSSSSSGGGGGGNLGASMAAAAGNISSSDDDDNDDDGDDDAGAAVDNETFAALTKAAKTKADKVKKIKEIERERDKENDGLRIWVKCSMIQSSI